MPIIQPAKHSQPMCPAIESPCQTLPTFARGQKVAFCTLCKKNVHNFSALGEPERRSLLRSTSELCVRYALVIPALVLGTALPVMAQDSDEGETLEPVSVTGGRVAPPEVVFRGSEIEESFDEVPPPAEQPKQ